MKGKRTGIEFEEHELLIVHQDGLSVHHLKKPDTNLDNIKYINTNGILAVTGDYGNWIFCREFEPTANNYASDTYWKEKLKIASTQESEEFDDDDTEAEIKKLLVEEEDLNEDEKEYLNNCLYYLGLGEFDYIHYAHRENIGRFSDHDYVPHSKRTKYWFSAVLDGFDEICRRMKHEFPKRETVNIESIPESPKPPADRMLKEGHEPPKPRNR